jgi:hypothetical protein
VAEAHRLAQRALQDALRARVEGDRAVAGALAAAEDALDVAARGVRDDVLGRTHERLAAAGALRRSSEAAATVPDQP